MRCSARARFCRTPVQEPARQLVLLLWFASGEPDLLVVQPSLQAPQHDVVDHSAVAQLPAAHPRARNANNSCLSASTKAPPASWSPSTPTSATAPWPPPPATSPTSSAAPPNRWPPP